MAKKTGKIFVLFLLGYVLFSGTASAALFDIWAGTGSGGKTCNLAPGGCSLCDGMTVAINLINSLTTVALILAVGMIVYGAIRLMLSAGSEQMVKEAKGIFTSAVIGLVIVLCGWLIINTVLHIIAGQIDFPWAAITCS